MHGGLARKTTRGSSEKPSRISADVTDIPSVGPSFRVPSGFKAIALQRIMALVQIEEGRGLSRTNT
jgi:hypothetical protein